MLVCRSFTKLCWAVRILGRMYSQATDDVHAKTGITGHSYTIFSSSYIESPHRLVVNIVFDRPYTIHNSRWWRSSFPHYEIQKHSFAQYANALSILGMLSLPEHNTKCGAHLDGHSHLPRCQLALKLKLLYGTPYVEAQHSNQLILL